MRLLVKTLAAILILITLTLIMVMANATVELTQGGVYKRIHLPIGVGEIKWNASGSLLASSPNLSILQGPVITRQQDSFKLQAWCQNRQIEQTLPLNASQIQLECAGQKRSYHFQHTPFSIQAELPQAQQIAVISDLEGNIDFFQHWALSSGVTDVDGNWAFGTGQVIILGDAVDRGRQVFDLLWRLYQLAQQAERAGGQLLLLHGNHEQYVMRGLVDRVETEHFWAIEQLMPYEQTFAANSVLGNWLRQQPIIARIGSYVFTHGGISPQVLQSDLSIAQLNQRYSATLSQANTEISDSDYQLFYGGNSLSQYRELLNEQPQQQQNIEQHLQQVLVHFDAKTLVIGHTPVQQPTVKYAGKLIAVEAEHTDSALVINNDEASFIKLDVAKQRFKEPKPQYRTFKLFSATDWRALKANTTHLRDLSDAKAFFNRDKKPG